MWFNFFTVLLIPFISVRKGSGELITDENRAREFLRCRDETILRRCENKEPWQFHLVGRTTHNFTWQNLTDPSLRRAFNITAQQEEIFLNMKANADNEESKKQFLGLRERRSIYSKSGACVYLEKERQTDENCKRLSMFEIRNKFYKVGNANERKYYWIAWRDSVGKMKPIFEESVRIDKISNEYPDIWLKVYEETSPTILQDVDKTFQEILPLYKEIHAFVRRRLINTYPNEPIRSNGPIPSHLLDLLTDFWYPIKDVALPYPEEKIDITERMKERNMKTIDILKLAEDFYHSIGLPKFGDNVWNNTKIPQNENCELTFNFNTFCNETLSGITACIPIDEFMLHAVISSVVNTYTFKWKRPDWPWMIHFLPSVDFYPALSQLVELSTWTNKYMIRIGCVNPTPADDDQITARDMNDLMKIALRFVPSLAYAYKQIKWRWVSYTTSNYNQKWWEYSLKYQGTCPPVRRTEENFDPATSGKIAMRNRLLGSFIGIVYSFQFHKAICEETGHRDFLHRCSLYGEKTFGDKLRNIMYLGNSIPAPEAISVMTNGASNKMDTKPLLEYFQPLYKWLKTKNENETVGWESDDPMVCP